MYLYSQNCIFEGMLNQLKSHINSQLDFLNQAKLLIAISGGIDSVVLTHLCHQLGLDIALAHCNFNLRGDESDADEDFVLQLSDDLNLEVFVQRFDTEQYAKREKCSIQMAARTLRYKWFDELSDQLGFDYILTAHHADDNLETFLINFIRGTGLEGLTGIPEVNGKFVRPLLPFSSHDIETFANQQNIKWRDDSSNASVKYLRNKLRHEVVPILKEINPSLLSSFQSTLSYLNDTADIIEESTSAVLKRAIETIDDNHIAFKISEFKKVNNPKAYLYAVFKVYGFTEWHDIVDLLDAESGKQVFSETHRLIKNRAHLLLSDRNPDESKSISILDNEASIIVPFGTLLFEEVHVSDKHKTHSVYVDKEALQFPLLLRKKEDGDVFYPLGMTGKKKLSKYFKDEKLSLLQKEQTWVLCSGDAIVWVVGRRADDRFKVTKDTETILKIEWQHK